MTEKEKHEYFGFDRFLQVVNTKYENELLELDIRLVKESTEKTENVFSFDFVFLDNLSPKFSSLLSISISVPTIVPKTSDKIITS